MTTAPLSYYTVDEIASLKAEAIPSHIAIIPDGNRRWAKEQLFPSERGHEEGADVLMEVVRAAKELGVKAITFYCFSTENWGRPPAEVGALMFLFARYILNQKDEMAREGIKLETIGDLAPLPLFLQEAIRLGKETTAQSKDFSLVLALNYGSRNEISRAIRAIVKDCEEGRLQREAITEELIGTYLETSRWGDPALLIRTSGELRLSNFLLWQLSYTEIYPAPVLWPAFTPKHLLAAITDFQSRERRWGGT